MKITVLQQDIVWKNPSENHKKMEYLLQNAPKSDIFIFPEMCSTGFCMQPEEIAEEQGGVTLEKMKAWAIKYDAAIVATIMTHAGKNFYNRMYFVTPEGVLEPYDKIHLFEYSGEDKIFTAGQKRVTWEWKGMRIRGAICYDIRFPLTLHNDNCYDLLIISANFPTSRILAWDTLIRARAIENQCYVAAANRVGCDEYGDYIGHSAIITPYGTTIASCNDCEEESATAETDFEMVEKMRKSHLLIHNSHIMSYI